MLDVRLIGRFEITLNGEVVRILSRAAQSLFACLILTSGVQHRREKLAGMFWPDAPEEKARAYLRHELWRLRKVLSAKSGIDYLISDDISVSFSPSSDYWLDVAVLKEQTENTSIAQLMNALSHYKGELLPGFYEDWIAAEREHLRTCFEEKFERLLVLLEAEKRWKEILDWAERWIAYGSVPEAAYRALMIAYEALGDRAKVTATYQRCLHALRELALDPSEETRALAFKRTSRLNIPIPLTSFIGREKELKEVATLFSKSRLITLTGSGGVGKTRLSIQVVADILDRFPDGVRFLDLAPLSDSALVPNTLANLLKLRESGEVSITDLLVNYLRFRTALIIFDNCEHIIETCARLVYTLLTSCENLTILATSRELLRVSGEIPYRVPSLEIPQSDAELPVGELSKIESVRLFTERASFASLDFALNSQNAQIIAQICQRLDGIPLAIELAAARVNVLSVQQILKRLDDRFNLLTHGLRSSLPRQQTLRAMIEWSYDLLSQKEQILFKRLAVFAGGWTLEAAEQVCSANGIEASEILDLLSQLVNKSLVLVETTNGTPRYRRLETIRQYAHEKLLEAGDDEAIRDKHLAYFVKLAEQARLQLRGAQQFVWLDHLDEEYDNIRAALAWAQKSVAVAAGLQLTTHLEYFWIWRAHLQEPILALEHLLVGQLPADQIQVVARGHRVLGTLQWLVGNKSRAESHTRESERLCVLLGSEGKAELAHARFWLLYFTRWTIAKEPVQMLQRYDEVVELFRETGDQWMMAETISSMGLDLQRSGNLIDARQALEQCLRLYRECGDSIGASNVNKFLGQLALEEGNYADARVHLEEFLYFCRQARLNIWIAMPLWMLGVIAVREGDYARAKELYTECLLFDQQIGLPRQLAECFIGFAGVAHAEKRFERAAQLLGAADAEVEARRLHLPRRIHLENFDQIELKRLTAVLCEELGNARFEVLASQGRVLTNGQAVALALNQADEP